MSHPKRSQQLRSLFDQHRLVRMPCAYDGLSAKIAQQAGFEAVAFSGNAVSASLLGLPDIGALTLSENVAHAGQIARNLDIPMICDADTGYGGIMNVMRTVREFEAAGVAGIHIEDQVTPKRCGLLPQDIAVLDQDEACQKIKAAVHARTDAKSMHGLEAAAQRARAYAHAGADAVLVMGANTPEELRYVADVVQCPLVVVVQESGPSADLSDDALSAVGCVFALHAGVARYAVVKALQDAFGALHRDGHTRAVRDRMASFEAYNQILGMDRRRACCRCAPAAHTAAAARRRCFC